MQKMKLLRTGAEAQLWKTEYKGENALLKKRVPKGYRNKVLDDGLRTSRTKREANLLHTKRCHGDQDRSLCY